MRLARRLLIGALVVLGLLVALAALVAWRGVPGVWTFGTLHETAANPLAL